MTITDYDDDSREIDNQPFNFLHKSKKKLFFDKEKEHEMRLLSKKRPQYYNNKDISFLSLDENFLCDKNFDSENNFEQIFDYPLFLK